jgi:prepilin-type processing-associated H-X9-DG protein
LVLALGVSLALALAYSGVSRHYRSMRSRTPTMDRLHQIGIAVLLYNLDHHGAYPNSLAELAKAEGLAANLARCPDDDGNDTQSTYVYLGRGLTADTADATTVVAHEPPMFFDGAGCNVLFGDGHTDWVWSAELPSVLAHGGPATGPATGPPR